MRENIDGEDGAAPRFSGPGVGDPDAAEACVRDGRPSELRLEIQRLAALLAERDERIRELEAIALEDDLTGLMNRRGLYDQLRRIISLGERYGIGAALVYVDLDRFKAVNDRHGHAIGDQILVEVARRIRATIRRSDFAGRLGGDEFLAVLWEADQAAVEAKAETIRSQIEDRPVSIGGLPIEVGASVGVAVIEPGDDVDAVVTRADRDMFRMKRGRKDEPQAAS